MPDDTPAKQDHPYVAHYDWPPDPAADDRFRLTPEKEALNAQHAADKQAVEGGRTVRLVLAAPIILWSFVGIAALALLAVVTILGSLGGAEVDTTEITAGMIGFFVLLILIEVASIWEGLMLMRDQLSAGRWRAVLVLSAVVAVIVTAALAVEDAFTFEGILVLIIVWYCTCMAVWQWRRSVRLASAVERLETYSP